MILFSIAEPFSNGKQTPIWLSAKRSTLWQAEKEFFKSNMDALTVLSIWDTEKTYLENDDEENGLSASNVGKHSVNLSGLSNESAIDHDSYNPHQFHSILE